LFVIITAVGMRAIRIHFMLCPVLHAHIHIHSAKRSLHGLHCNQDKYSQNHVFHVANDTACKELCVLPGISLERPSVQGYLGPHTKRPKVMVISSNESTKSGAAKGYRVAVYGTVIRRERIIVCPGMALTCPVDSYPMPPPPTIHGFTMPDVYNVVGIHSNERSLPYTSPHSSFKLPHFGITRQFKGKKWM
jgi:hypothetical protein